MMKPLPWKLWMLTALLLVLSVHTQAQKETGAFWDNVGGPYGVSLWSSLVTDDGTYFGGSGLGQIYRRLPDEDKWKIVYVSDMTIMAFYAKGSTIYCGDGVSLIHSVDNGDTWEQEEGFPASADVRGITENNNGDLIVGGAGGVYKKTTGKDGSSSWELKSFHSNYAPFAFSVCRTPSGVLFAGTGRGIFRSDDEGETWTISGLDETANTIMSVAANSQGDVYAGTMDRGLLINYADDDKPNGWISPGIEEVLGGVRKINVINGTDVFVSISAKGLYYSNNNTDWQKVLQDDCRAGTSFDPITRQVVTASFKGGIYTSPMPADGIQYTQIGIPLDVSRIYSYDAKLIASAESDHQLFSSQDRGETWTSFFQIVDGFVTCFAQKDNDDMFVGCFGGLLLRPWIQAEIYIEAEKRRGWWSIGFPPAVTIISDILITQKDSVYVGTNAGLCYISSRDYGGRLLSVIGEGVNIVTLKQALNGDLYAGTNKGIYISTDDGLTWQTHWLDGVSVNEMAFDGDHVLAATDDGLYDIPTASGTPELIQLSIKGGPVTSVTVDGRGHTYATSADDVYYAESRTATWASVDEGIENYKHWRLHAVNNEVYVTTNVGIYKHAYADLAEISLSGLGIFAYNGATRRATATTNPAGLPVTLLYNGQENEPVEGGTYDITAIVQDENYAGQKKGRITITKIEATITLSGLGAHYYNGNPVAVTATTIPAGLPVMISYENKAETPVEIGEYYVLATIDHPSYYGKAEGDLVIQDPIMGTEDPENKLVKVYPVPAKKGITIESDLNKILSIAVFNTLGTQIDQVSFSTPVNRHDLATTAYPPGVLVVMITTDKYTRVIKRAEIIR